METLKQPGPESWRVCRTCMREAESMCALYSDSQQSDSPGVAELISTCTGLQVEKSDGLPEHICNSCFETLSSFFQFRSNAVRSNTLLRSLLARRNLPIKADNPAGVKDEPHDFDLPLTFLDDCLEHQLDEFSDDDRPLIKKEDSKSKETTNTTAAVKQFCCPVCGKLFFKLSKLRRHEKTHQNGKSRRLPSHNECGECFKIFKKPVHLKRHMLVHDLSRKPYICSQCPQRFRDKGRLLSHLVTHQQLPGDIDPVKKELEISSERLESVEVHQCAHCVETYQSAHALAAHMRKHRPAGRVLACSICAKVFTKTSHLKRHERSHEDNRPYKCNLCSKSFAMEGDLSEHQNKHKGVKPHVCPVCAKAFSQRSTLTCHVRVHTRERPYLCPTCGKRFDSSTNLNQHQRRHAGVKSFACLYCPGRFVSKGELNSHMSTHTGARPFVCDTCGSSFTKPNSLAKHKLRHLGIKPHECDVCRTRFTSKEHLKRHYRIHTGEKPYRCELCERAFTQSNDLVKHKRAHLGDNLYKCEQCTESFRLKTELRDHMSSHFIHSQVAAGIPISFPPVLANKPPPEPAAPDRTADKPIVLMQASNGAVLTIKRSELLVQALMSSGVREQVIAEHVKNNPMAISVTRISGDHSYSENTK